MNLPKISIVTPSFNQGRFIEQTIQSVLGQNYPNLEFVIIDGGSTDETTAIIRKYEKQVTYWVSEPDRGQSHAINKGLAHCTGEVFNWLNSDDFLEPGALFHIAEEYARKPFSALCGRVNVWDTDVFSHVRNSSYVGPTAEDSVAAFNINQEGTWWSLEKVKKTGGVNEELHYCMDLELWFRLLLISEIGDIRTTETILSNFRRHPAAKSTSEGKKGKQSPFLSEQAMLFEQMKPEKVKWSWYDLMNVLFDAKYSNRISFYNQLDEKRKVLIKNKRLFKMATENFYLGNIKVSENAISKIGLFPKGISFRDLFFIRRRILKSY